MLPIGVLLAHTQVGTWLLRGNHIACRESVSRHTVTQQGFDHSLQLLHAHANMHSSYLMVKCLMKDLLQSQALLKTQA